MKLLQPVSSSPSTIKDSFEFASWVRNHQLSGKSHLCSFDVSSLFTNIPIDETIEICIHRLENSSHPPSIPTKQLRKLFQYATKKSHFLFNGTMYDFTDGMAMGSPLAPVMADIFMIDFEEKFIKRNIPSFSPSIWKRYVDDTFCIFESSESALKFLNFLNNCHHNIKFTYEGEQDNKLPFLDVLVEKVEGNIKTSIFHKKTFTGLYTKWDSFTTRKYKINLIRTLTYRHFHICSDDQTLNSSLIELKRLLTKNGYPSGVINFHISDVLRRQRNPKDPVQLAPKKKLTLTVPYLGENSEKLRRSLEKCFSIFTNCAQPNIVFSNATRIASFFNIKDKVPSQKRAKVVYLARCIDCPEYYIGKTKRRLDDRKGEHFKALTNTDKKSSIADHIFKTGHNIDWDNFEILCTGSSDREIKIKETFFIREMSPAMNGNEGSERLTLF